LPWTIEFDRRALRDLQQLDRAAQRRILAYLEQRVVPAASPRDLGEALTSTFAGLWRYRVGDYRVICRLEDACLVVLVVRIGHRRDVYER
jgi:mRNA interferase RelE/StbE